MTVTDKQKIQVNKVYQTTKGTQLIGDSLTILQDEKFKEEYKGKINLLFTSPPFDLNKPKEYGNLTKDEYITWFVKYAKPSADIISPDGSIVIELGNSWNYNEPTFDLTPLKALMLFMEEANLYLCQEIICNNPARLPSPITYVNKDRIRLKDSYTRLWWFSKTPNPKANNKNILKPYSKAMASLIQTQKYNSGKRPSGYNIGETSFLKDNGGAIQSTFLENIEFSNGLSISNTNNNKTYRQYCLDNNFKMHPARMQKSLVEFFVKFLTDENDIVLDIFSGSNTTGYVAENLNRKWVSIEASKDYAFGSHGRFINSK